MNQPLPQAKAMTSSARIEAMNGVRQRVLSGSDVSEEELRWAMDLLREERSDASKHRRKEGAAVKEANSTPAVAVSAADL